jgi:signal transduction histidine kinase/DNA-binding NarL/FixJ family response regulator/HPt (histidine-containing phosphotransfer) domain-containing protein
MYTTYLNESQERFLEAIHNDLSTGLQNAKAGAYALEISDEFRQLFLYGDRADILKFIDSFCEELKVTFVNMTDKEGNIILRSYLPDDYSHDSIYYQTGIQNALKGERFASFERSSIVRASARATAPIWNDDEIIGAVVVAFRFDTDEWADDAKKLYGVDISVFSDDLGCIITTIIDKDGTRKIGEPMIQAAYTATYTHGEQFRDKNYLFGILYDSLYIPIKNSQDETFVVLCVSVPADRIFHETLSFSLICALVALLSLGVTAFVLLSMAGRIVHSQNELKTALEEAKKANSAKSDFLARMSHEIRTPMNAVLGISEIQLQNKTLPLETEAALGQIYDSGNLLLHIINDILDFSKIEAGKMEIIPAKYDVPSLINDSVQLSLLRYESKPLEFKLDLDENTPLELYGDELRIKQILNNLLSNAFKYTDKGEIKLSVSAEKEKDNETMILVFRVSDTGQGMSEDQVARLFDEYSRFNMETNRSVTGTGLGMNIVKRLIDMMEGGIFVESEPGKGTTFTVRLPQKSIGPAVCGAELADNLRNFRFHSAPISKKAQIVREYMPYGSVMIVDDVASNLYVAKGLLAPYGLRIEMAASGAEAIEKIKAGNVYDIVFMDHMMPVMDGIEATKIIRGMGYKHPVIALTANAVIGQSDIFLANDFDGFIPKPIDSRELNAALNRYIRDKQPREVIEATRQEQRKRETENTVKAVPEIKDMSEMGRFFVLDAENARGVIEEVFTKLPDAEALGSYITAVHGMKSALANIGENELSAVARRLEQAGKEKDLAVITEETPGFTGALLVLIDKYKPVINEDTVELTDNDMVYLRDKLLEIKTACQTFDITAAEEALDNLRQKAWPRHVSETLDEISLHLLHSDFGKAVAVAENKEL